ARAARPRLPKAVLELLSREEIQAMDDAAKTERDKLIIVTLADSGIRVGELVRLRTGCLSSQGRQHYLRVRGKGEGVSCRSRASTRGSAATATAAAEGRRVRPPLRGPQAAAGEPGRRLRAADRIRRPAAGPEPGPHGGHRAAGLPSPAAPPPYSPRGSAGGRHPPALPA